MNVAQGEIGQGMAGRRVVQVEEEARVAKEADDGPSPIPYT